MDKKMTAHETKELRTAAWAALNEVQATRSQERAIRDYIKWLEARVERVKAIAREIEVAVPTDSEDDCG